MQLEVIGVGGAGCRIADAIRAADDEATAPSFVADAFAFDTDVDGLTDLGAISETHRHRYGETIDRGLDGNLHRGLEVGEECVDELSRQLDQGQPSLADAFLVVVGLGGATGGGTAPHLVANLQTLYDEPVYVLATLPAKSELEEGAADEIDDRGTVDESATNGPASDTAAAPGTADDAEQSAIPEAETRPLAEKNAVETLERLDGLATATICFDNELWLRPREGLGDGRERLNREIATRVGAFFASTADTSGLEDGDGRTRGNRDRHADSGAETVIDANDVGRILGTESDIVSLGYGTQRVETDDGGSLFGLDIDLGLGLFGSDSSVDTGAAFSAVETTIRKALRGKLTLECERENADRAMLIVGGPPAWLNRRAISEGRETLESAIGSVEILGGDAPRADGDEVFAVVVLSGVDPVERLETMRAENR
ncbi:cell division protein FtsZ [Halopiger xanaduensis]|uniref:Tubulin-like protein CetZ n=1 Tax=Halopiger xanaduensis (strain DSM 18323 / JCM 14033 / SH-6) TaxID=797210 RepID=F8DAH2_HALXS|nr:cell division protein FtsZ [Halopiger xanaduensis]AEH35777.1 Tubulin/FtsZ GTPase [Halopiger xanaduensis SH-6]